MAKFSLANLAAGGELPTERHGVYYLLTIPARWFVTDLRKILTGKTNHLTLSAS